MSVWRVWRGSSSLSWFLLFPADWAEPQIPRQYRILSLDIFRPPLSLIHSCSPHDRHYCSFLMCPTTEDKVRRDKWAPKIQRYFTDCFFWFWCIKWAGDVGMQDAEQLLAQPAGWRRFSLFLKGDYEGENVEPNDRKVSRCTGGFNILTRAPAWRVTCWNLDVFGKISQKMLQKDIKFRAV